MKKCVWKKMIVGILLAMTVTINVQAQTTDRDAYAATSKNEDSVLLPEEERQSVDRANGYARGDIISTAIASITNLGEGKLEILLETLAHHQCVKIRHVAYLERWNDEFQDWDQVARYEFEELAEEHPDESFTALTSLIIVDDQPTGYHYRVRGAHKVWGEDGYNEGFTTRTNGVVLTK